MYILYLKAQMAFLWRVKLGKPFQDAHIIRRRVSHEKKPSHFPWYWLVSRDSSYWFIVITCKYHITGSYNSLYTLNSLFFFHCSRVVTLKIQVNNCNSRHSWTSRGQPEDLIDSKNKNGPKQTCGSNASKQKKTNKQNKQTNKQMEQRNE